MQVLYGLSPNALDHTAEGVQDAYVFNNTGYVKGDDCHHDSVWRRFHYIMTSTLSVLPRRLTTYICQYR